MNELLAIIEKKIGASRTIHIQSGKCKNVTDSLCDVEREGDLPELLEVRLNAAKETTDYVTIVPKDGADVLVGLMDGQRAEAFIVSCSEVEKVIWKIGTSELVMDKEGWKIMRGDESLKKILDDLLTAISKLTVTTSTGPSGTPINIADFQKIQQRIPNLLT